jgi:transcriptional regulator with XRE-family HTH domain
LGIYKNGVYQIRCVINKRDGKYLKAFGKNLRKIRRERGLSQGQLEFESEVSKNQIGNIERGEVNTTLSTLKLIAKALDIPVKELFDFE